MDLREGDEVYKFSVEVYPDYIQLLCNGREVLYWDQQEWIEDPNLIRNIVELTRLAYAEPEELVEKLRTMRRL
jgi:hypothetical protein